MGRFAPSDWVCICNKLDLLLVCVPTRTVKYNLHLRFDWLLSLQYQRPTRLYALTTYTPTSSPRQSYDDNDERDEHILIQQEFDNPGSERIA